MNALIALGLVLTANISFFHQLLAITPSTGIHLWLFMASSVVLLWSYLYVVLTLISWPYIRKPLVGFVILASMLTAFCVDSFGVGIDRGQIQNLLETNLTETRDTLTPMFWLRLLLLAVVPIVLLCRIKTPKLSMAQFFKQKLIALGLGLGLMILAIAPFYADYAAIFRENRDLKSYITPHNSIGSLIGYTRRHVKTKPLPLITYGADARKLASSTPRLLILVVGETARAESFSLGGYAHLTNPELAKRGVTYFSQVSSCGTATAVSVPCMFSGMTRKSYDPDLAKHREGLLDVLRYAGYKIDWIDNNSGCKGACDRIDRLIIQPEEHPQWCHDHECLDEILVEQVADLLKNQPARDRVIVLHQMGSHGPAYYLRYSPSAKHFQPTCDTNAIQTCDRQSLINTYDNTIVYTDHVLASLIDVLKAHPQYQSALWYVSDHGESTGEHGLYLHGAPYMLAPSQQTHVPMLTWLSPALEQHRPQLANCLRAQTQQPRSHDNLFHTVLGLMQVQSQVYDPALDMTQTCQSH